MKVKEFSAYKRIISLLLALTMVFNLALSSTSGYAIDVENEVNWFEDPGFDDASNTQLAWYKSWGNDSSYSREYVVIDETNNVLSISTIANGSQRFDIQGLSKNTDYTFSFDAMKTSAQEVEIYVKSIAGSNPDLTSKAVITTDMQNYDMVFNTGDNTGVVISVYLKNPGSQVYLDNMELMYTPQEESNEPVYSYNMKGSISNVETLEANPSVLPMSDTENAGNWQLSSMSDEFDGEYLDPDMWLNDHRTWDGRDPGPYSTENVRLEDGKLVLTSHHDGYQENGDPKYTTACAQPVYTTGYGYYEVSARSAPISMTSAFWFKVHSGLDEIDVYEQVGRAVKDPGYETMYPMNYHISNDATEDPQDTIHHLYVHDTEIDLTDTYNTYGLEWGPDYLYFYFNGELVRRVENNYFHEEQYIYFDMEPFVWKGYAPEDSFTTFTQEDGEVRYTGDYHIEYMRVWRSDEPQAYYPDPNISLPEIGEVKTAQAVYGTPDALLEDGTFDEIWNTAQKLEGYTAKGNGASEIMDMRTMWDEENLYVFAIVEDTDVFVNHTVNETGVENSHWKGDSIELLFDFGNQKRDHLDSDDLFIRILPDGHGYSGELDAMPEGTSYEASINEDGYYVIQLTMPLNSSNNPLNAQNGTTIGFDVQINAGSTTSQNRYASANWNDISGNIYQMAYGSGNLELVNTLDTQPSDIVLPKSPVVTPNTTMPTDRPVHDVQYGTPADLLEDGTIDEIWNTANAVDGFFTTSQSIEGMQENVDVRLLWDEDYLYVLAQVEDDDRHVSQNSNAEWNGDALELFIDMGDEKGASYDENDIYISLLPDDRNTDIYTSVDLGTKYIIQAAVPFNSVGKSFQTEKGIVTYNLTPENNVVLGFEAQIDVATQESAGRIGTVNWFNDDNSAWQKMEKTASVRLVGAPEKEEAVQGVYVEYFDNYDRRTDYTGSYPYAEPQANTPNNYPTENKNHEGIPANVPLTYTTITQNIDEHYPTGGRIDGLDGPAYTYEGNVLVGAEYYAVRYTTVLTNLEYTGEYYFQINANDAKNFIIYEEEEYQSALKSETQPTPIASYLRWNGDPNSTQAMVNSNAPYATNSVTDGYTGFTVLNANDDIVKISLDSQKEYRIVYEMAEGKDTAVSQLAWTYNTSDSEALKYLEVATNADVSDKLIPENNLRLPKEYTGNLVRGYIKPIEEIDMNKISVSSNSQNTTVEANGFFSLFTQNGEESITVKTIDGEFETTLAVLSDGETIVPTVDLTKEPEQVKEVEQWDVLDIDFKLEVPAGSNPYMDTAGKVDVVFTHTSGETIETRAFYKDNGVWAVRFTPSLIGEWNYTVSYNTQNPLPGDTSSEYNDDYTALFNGLNGVITAVEGTNPNLKGALIQDTEYSNHLQYENGEDAYIMGYEVDWMGIIAQGDDAALENAKTLIDNLAAAGVNEILMNSFGWDTGWAKGTGTEITNGVKDYSESDIAGYNWGATDIIPWEFNGDVNSSQSNINFEEMNEEYWVRFDEVVEYMNEQGITAHIFWKVYNKSVQWPDGNKNTDITDIDTMYARYFVDRYSAYNVVLDLGKESYGLENVQKSYDYITAMAEEFNEANTYNRIVTVHDYDGYYESIDELPDAKIEEMYSMFTDQYHGTSSYNEAVKWMEKFPTLPYYQSETNYQWANNGHYQTYRANTNEHSPEASVWEYADLFMAGAYSAHYYTVHAWDVVKYDEMPEHMEYFTNLTNFATEVVGIDTWQQMTADNSIVNPLSNGKYEILWEKGNTSELKTWVSQGEAGGMKGQASRRGMTISGDGNHYLVFTGFGDDSQNVTLDSTNLTQLKEFTVNFTDVSQPLEAVFYNVLTGEKVNAGTITDTGSFTKEFTLPEFTTTVLETNGVEKHASGESIFLYVYPVDELPKEDIEIVSVEKIAEIKVEEGVLAQDLELPKTVSVTLSDNTVATVNVNWDLSGYNPEIAGNYTITGTLVDIPDGLLNTELVFAELELVVGEINNDDVHAILDVTVDHATAAKEGMSYFDINLEKATNIPALEFDITHNGTDIEITTPENFILLPKVSETNENTTNVVLVYTGIMGESFNTVEKTPIVKVSVTGTGATIDVSNTEITHRPEDGSGEIMANVKYGNLTVTYSLNYDVNNDGVINILDLAEIQKYYGARKEYEIWVQAQQYDFDFNGAVDIMDVMAIYMRME